MARTPHRPTRMSSGSRTRQSFERRLRARILGPAVEDQVAEEIDLHVELLAREMMDDGMSEAWARAAAAQAFSDRSQVAATCARIARQTERRWRWRILIGEMRDDARYALRQLARTPSFAAVALLTLALGIGATTAIFSVVEGVVLRRLPFAHPDRVMAVAEMWKEGDSDLSVGNFVDLAAAARGFAALGAERFQTLNLTGGDEPERVLTAPVSHGFFAVFGVRPQLGRTFTEREDQPGAEPVAILSDALWRDHLAADPAILEHPVHLSGRVYRVVGVMPPGFDPTLSHEELWLPIAFTPAQRAEHDDHYLTVVGLLRPGVSAGAAQAELSVAMRHIAALHPAGNSTRTGVHVVPLADSVVGSYRQRLLVLLGAVGLVLLIACANVASLLLARGAGRARELAIRTAVGAGAARIARQLLCESAVLALAGGALGLGLAQAAVRLLVPLAPAGIPRLGETRIDSGVLLFTLAVSLAASLLFGMAPALRSARQDPQALLRAGTAAGAGRARDRLRSLLVLAEVGLALTLLVGAGLLIRSALHLERTPPGFDAANLMGGRLSLPEATYPRPEMMLQTFSEMAGRLARQPGVRAAAAVSAVPLGPFGSSNGLIIEGQPRTAEDFINAGLHLVTDGYFSTMRIPLLAGRTFTGGDVAGRERVMIVSRELARQAWGDANPLGKRMLCCEGGPGDPRWKTVIGVVGDVHTRGLAAEVRPEFYLPIGQAPPAAWTWIQRTMTLVARGQSPRLLAGALRATVRGGDPSLPLTLVPMEEALHGSTAEARFHTMLLLTLGLLGLFLAAVGVYGVIAHFAGLRTREIGIRMALGARRRNVLALIAWQGVPPVAGGLAAGTAGALAATRGLQGSLHGVSSADPLTFLCVILVLAATAGLAVLIPALAATRVDPQAAILER